MRPRTCFSIIAAILAILVSGAHAEGKQGKPWLAERARWESWLASAEVVSVEDVGHGVTNPHRVALRMEGIDFFAVFKPIRRGRHHGYWESYESEVAAYELDKLLGLDMVPPTVVRRVGANLGSLQLWIEGCQTYKVVETLVPRTPDFSHQLSRMKMFDNLVYNADRNAGNFLLDSDWQIVLIDHSRAFLERKSTLESGSKAPAQYDRRLVERLRGLDQPTLEGRLGELLSKRQIEALLARRDRILEHLASLVAERGEGAVLFE